MAKKSEPIPEPTIVPEAEFQPLPQEDEGGLKSFRASTNKRFADMEQVTKAILFVAIISLVGIIVAVSGLVLDQMHYSNSSYEQRNQYYEDQIRLLKEQNDILREQVRGNNGQETVQPANP